MAAWPPHSLDHSDRRRIFVAAGTALYSPKCSRLYNLQGLWSVPATWCSHPLHLKDRQNVQNSAQHTAHPQERGSCQAKGRRRDRWGYLIQSHFSIEPTAGSSWQGKTRRRRAILPSERGLGEILVLKCGCLGSSGSLQTRRLLSALMARALQPWSYQRQTVMFFILGPFV